MVKNCPKCSKTKNIKDFPRNKSSKDGFYYLCKDCVNTKHQKQRQKSEYRTKEIIARRQRYKECMNDPVYREKRRQYQKEYRKKNSVKYDPIARRSHKAVEAAVMRGDLPPITTQNCVECNKQAEHYHHHNGYTQEHLLDVVPLCAKCHGKTWRTVHQ